MKSLCIVIADYIVGFLMSVVFFFCFVSICVCISGCGNLSAICVTTPCGFS